MKLKQEQDNKSLKMCHNLPSPKVKNLAPLDVAPGAGGTLTHDYWHQASKEVRFPGCCQTKPVQLS